MNHLKKLFLPIICLWAFIPYGIGQNENSGKTNVSIKPFYSVAANFGISTTSTVIRRSGQYDRGAEVDFLYKALVYGADFSGGIELKHYFKAGLGLGYFYYKQDDYEFSYIYFFDYWICEIIPDFINTHGIPLFLFMRSDFLDKKTSPYVDFKIGNNFLITKETATLHRRQSGYPTEWIADEYGEFRLKNGLFLASNIGVAFKMKSRATLNASIGYRYVSQDRDFMVPQIDGYNEKIRYNKSGYIAVDHQFVLNVGVSF